MFPVAEGEEGEDEVEEGGEEDWGISNEWDAEDMSMDAEENAEGEDRDR